MNCSNCGRPMAEHCWVHLVPCCPGKCPITLDDYLEIIDRERNERRGEAMLADEIRRLRAIVEMQ
ncbi:MAG: hypothetical protein ACRDYV_02165 [Acidimicrobiia bacterium]